MRTRSILATGALLLAALACRDEQGSPTGPVASPLPAVVLSDSWITRAEMPRSRSGHATATVTNAAGQSVLYVIGGATSRGGLQPATNQAYNVATNRWTTVAPQPRRYLDGNGAGVIQGRIYIAGGYSPNNEGGSAYSALYMYDPDEDTWVAKRPMPSGGMRGVSGVINDRFYVLTGCPLGPNCYGDPPLAFYRYDPTVDQWATLPPPPRPHHSGMAGVIGGKLYVVGGWDGTQYGGQLDVYDPAANQWTTKASMPRERFRAMGVALGGKLYVIGGNIIDPDNTVWDVRTTAVYDPATDTWTRKAPLPTALGAPEGSRVVLNGKPRIEVVAGHYNLQYVP